MRQDTITIRSETQEAHDELMNSIKEFLRSKRLGNRRVRIGHVVPTIW